MNRNRMRRSLKPRLLHPIFINSESLLNILIRIPTWDITKDIPSLRLESVWEMLKHISQNNVNNLEKDDWMYDGGIQLIREYLQECNII